MKKIIFFDNKKQALAYAEDESILITDNVNDGIALKRQGFNVRFPEDFFSLTDIQAIDKECLEFTKFIIKAKEENVFLEYVVTPYFIRVFKIFSAMDNLFEKEKSEEIFAIGSGRFIQIVSEYLKQRGRSFHRIKPNFLEKIFYQLKELGRESQIKWINTEVRIFILEPFWIVALFCMAKLRIVGRGNFFHRGKTKNLLVFAGDRFSLPIYQELKNNKDWEFILAGKTYPGRKLLMKEKIIWLEEYAGWKDIAVFFQRLFGYRRDWRDFQNKFSGKFLYKSINFWELCRGNLRMHFLTTLPLMGLVHDSALNIFPGRKAVVFMSNDVTDYNRALCLAAKESRVKSLNMQHGILIEPNVHSSLTADRLAGWGQATVDWYQREGNDSSRVVITGSPRFDCITGITKSGRRGKKIVLVATNFYTGFSSEDTYLLNFEMIYAVLEAVRGNDDIEIKIKIHPGESLSFYKDFLKAHPDIEISRSNFYELLAVCDVFVSIYSTTVLEAVIFKKPIIFFRNPYNRRAFELKGGIAREAENAVQMREAIKELINNPRDKKKIEAGQQEFLDYHVCVDGRCTERVINLLKKLANS
ncbi:MAG: CDP-glycerol glycerophosphotransferase family protein [Candidatus Paceibacterota bacterium]|jgi:CDP-glycerol glycerophosphotransferase (TagB/SpsB family)